MTVLRPYPAYSDVGARWLTSLPTGWGVRRARYLCRIDTGSGDTVNAEPHGEYPFIVRSQTALAAATYDFDCEAILTAGDGGVGEVFHHLRGRFLAHQRVYVLHEFQPEVDTRFFFYYFSSLFRLMAQDGSARTTVDSVRRWMLADMPIALPPIDEQRLIARYLDSETARIDELLEQQRALIETLRERRTAARDAHLAGRDGKRSTTVRRVLQPMNRPPAPGLGVVTAYRDGVVTLRSNRRDDGYTFSDSEQGYQEVLPGDLVFHALDGFAGAVGLSDSHGVCTPVYHVCRVVTDDVPEYVAMLLRHLGTSGFLAAQAPNVRERSVDFRNWQTFARIPLYLPSPKEQREIVADISQRTLEIDTLVAKAGHFVELARERRGALINAAVTGQIDVRAVA